MGQENPTCHIIPRFILKKFAFAEESRIWCLRKEDPDLKPFCVNITGAFAPKNEFKYQELDGVLKRTGNSNLKAEHLFSDWENRVATIFREIYNMQDQDKKLLLTDKNKLDLFKYARLTLLRNPDNEEAGFPYDSESLASEEEIRNEYGDSKNQGIKDSQRNAKIKYAIIPVLTQPLPTPDKPRTTSFTYEQLLSLHLDIRYAKQPVLVIGSFPYAKIDNIHWFPISPQVAIALNNCGQLLTMDMDKEFSQQMNQQIFQKSKQIAALKKEQLLDLIEQDKQAS